MSASIIPMFTLIEGRDPFQIPPCPRPPPPQPPPPSWSDVAIAGAVGLLVGLCAGVGVSALVFLS